MSIPIALQLYSVRDDAAKDLLGVIDAVGKMGYDGVEFAGYHGHSAEAVKAALDAAGLKVAGTHLNLSFFTDEKFDETIAFHTTIGCKNLVIPWIPKEKRDTDATTTATAAELTILAGRLRELGFRTGFHVHGDDMLPLDSGKTAWQILGENTPDDFIMQYDTANGMSAGADPIEPILAFPGRGITEHLKEWSGEHGAAVIGEGNVPWTRVFEACETVAGTEWYIVEHESYEGMTPMESVQRCLENLRKMGK